MPSYYPVFLDLKNKHCLIFGGGAVAESKLAKLLESSADVTVISPEITAGIREALQPGKLEWEAREYQPGDLAGAFLGIAATNLRGVNELIFREAEELGVLINVVDEPEQCSFIAPSVVSRGPVTVAISTDGTSPALARKLRETLDRSSVLDWADLAGVLSRTRKQVKKQGALIDPQRWQCCLTPELLEMARAGREEEAMSSLLGNLLGEGTSRLCPALERCLPEGCQGKSGDGAR